MIKANELRIGNWKSAISNSNVYSQVTIDDFYEEYTTGQAFFHMQPIPLTKEWLLKFGFEFESSKRNGRHFNKIIELFPQNPDHYGRSKRIIPLLYLEGRAEKNGDQDDRWHPEDQFCFMWGEFREMAPGRDINIVYVHQLQNLYFSLTGEDLMIKEKV